MAALDDLHKLSLSDVCRRIKSGEFSSSQVTLATLSRIARFDAHLHSYAMVPAEQALADAERLDERRAAGQPLGPLHGVPIAIKDLLFTSGLATASGTRVMADFVPDFDATVVTKLRDAGAVIIGKTQLTEGAFGAHHPSIQAPQNPWHADYWPGVSSSGSGVSVAAGLAYGALGTDTGGSIRFPSAANGLVGIKPTYGRVSRFGAFELAASLDHIGPMTRTVEDAARLLGVLAGADANDTTTLSSPVPNYVANLATELVDLVIGVDWDYVTTGVQSAVVNTLREALTLMQDLGAQVREVSIPPSYAALVEGWGTTCGVECARAHAEFYPARKGEYGPVLASLIERGLAATPQAYAQLEQQRGVFREELEQLFGGVGVLLMPCMPMTVPRWSLMNQPSAEADALADFLTFTAPYDYSGHPTITLPGRVEDGLPSAFQLVGALGDEAGLVRAGSAYEIARGEIEYPELG